MSDELRAKLEKITVTWIAPEDNGFILRGDGIKMPLTDEAISQIDQAYSAEIEKARNEEHDYMLGLTAGVAMIDRRIADSLLNGIQKRKEQT